MRMFAQMLNQSSKCEKRISGRKAKRDWESQIMRQEQRALASSWEQTLAPSIWLLHSSSRHVWERFKIMRPVATAGIMKWAVDPDFLTLRLKYHNNSQNSYSIYNHLITLTNTYMHNTTDSYFWPYFQYKNCMYIKHVPSQTLLLIPH